MNPPVHLPSPTDDLQSAAHQVLSAVFGYTAFRGQQADIVEQVAAGGDALVLPDTQSYRVSVDPAMRETWLELNTRVPHRPWWYTLAAGLMGVFLLLSALASV